MNIHKNARTTPNMQVLIVATLRAGETPRSVAGAVGVSPATVRKWLRRHESEGVAGLEDRTSRPHRLRTRVIRADHAGRSPAPEPSTLLENRPRERAVARAKNKRKGRTLRADLLAGMGLRQTIQSFIRTGRRTVAFPPQL